MRCIFQTAKAIQVLGNANPRTLETFTQVFNKPATSNSSVFVESYVSLVVSSGGCKEIKRIVPEIPKPASANKVLFFLQA